MGWLTLVRNAMMETLIPEMGAAMFARLNLDSFAKKTITS